MINWVVWDSCAFAPTGWEDGWSDTCGLVGFETLSDAWDYYKRHSTEGDYVNFNGTVVSRWCNLPQSVIARNIDPDTAILW